MNRTKYIALFLILLSGIPCFSQVIDGHRFNACIPEPPSPPRLVNDLGGFMDAIQVSKLENKLVAFEEQTSNQVTIVTIPGLKCPADNELSPEQFANELGRKWGVGTKGKKNGVVLLASKADRQLFLKPAQGLEGALPDIICAKIIREEIVPNFRNGNFYKGFDDASDAIIKATRGEYTKDTDAEGSPVSFIIIIILFLLFFIIFMRLAKRKNIYVSRRGWKYDTDTWDNLPRSGGGWISGGWGGNSGSGWGGGGGGFGGFGGGGGFSGGGAGGSW